MSRRITAICNALPHAGVPTEIVYVPEGKTKIFPGSHPEGIWVNLPADKGATIAAAFDTDLKKKLGENVRPWIDFEHTAKYPSAGIPTAFRYEPGVGLMCAMDWSLSGRRAIRGKDVRYFSPRFDLDENGIPVSLPDRGPLGGLVTEPAFRDMRPIAASEADNPNPSEPMSLKLLVACGLLTDSEAARENAETLASQRVVAHRADTAELAVTKTKLEASEKEAADWKKKFEDAEAASEAERGKSAKAKVEAAVADGRIAPKDEDTQKAFLDRLTAGDSLSERILASMPKLHEGLDKPVVKGTEKQSVVASADPFVTEARKLVEAKRAATEEEAFTIVASEKPELYETYMKQFAV